MQRTIKKKQQYAIRISIPRYFTWLLTLLVLNMYLMVPFLDELIRAGVAYPWNYVILGAIELGAFGIIYLIMSSWFEATTAKTKKVKMRYYTNFAIFTAVGIAAYFIGTVTLFYFRDLNHILLIYYGMTGAGILWLIIGIGTAEDIRQLELPKGLRPRKRREK